jgi:hypothetical protein
MANVPGKEGAEFAEEFDFLKTIFVVGQVEASVVEDLDDRLEAAEVDVGVDRVPLEDRFCEFFVLKF